MERVEMIPPLLPGTAGAVDARQWTSSGIWEPDDPTVLYDPRYRFPPEELAALAFGLGGLRAGSASAASFGKPGYVLVRMAPREPARPVVDEEAALEACWDDRVREMIDELLKDDDGDEAAIQAEETAPAGGGVQEAFQWCKSSSTSSSSGGVAPQQPEPETELARPRRKTHRYRKKKDRQ